MNQHAAEQKYEQAALLRDKIVTLRKIQEHQAVSQDSGDADIVAVSLQNYGCAIHKMIVRSGKVVGTFNHFPRISLEVSAENIIEQYIVQNYLLSDAITSIPNIIIVNQQLQNAAALEKIFLDKLHVRIHIADNVRGERASWQKLAITNADQSLKMKTNSNRNNFGRIQNLANKLGLDEAPQLFECYDISHTFGEATYASCVVFGQNGPEKSQYRLFSIKETNKGDDYAAMSEVIRRRFRHLEVENLPDLICIDGGKGQLTAVLSQLQQMEIIGIPVLGVAKGKDRRPGMETLFFTRVGDVEKPAQIILPNNSPALHLIQHIRDEAHRFAITHHRKKRAKTRKRSLLEDIDGVGIAKRKQLIKYFGGLSGVTNASATDLQKVPSISTPLAEKIYKHLHDN